MSGQTETVFKSRLTDKEEEGARLKAEVNILHEKLSQTQAQVGGVVVVESYLVKTNRFTFCHRFCFINFENNIFYVTLTCPF